MIYFLRRADGKIKIGTTINFQSRHSTLVKDHGTLELLGIMDGDRNFEQQLHKQFVHLLAEKREWFQCGEDLLAFIAENTTTDIPPAPAPERPTKQVRVYDDTAHALNVIASTLSYHNGREYTMAEIIEVAVRKHYPGICEGADEMLRIARERKAAGSSL